MSAIKSMEIENFMSIDKAVIEFDDKNIIQLCGYNDSGKSAVIRLLDIMFYNAYSSIQAKFIKDGEKYFKGVLTFDDGVVYERYKFASGVSLYNLYKDDKLIYTNKSGDAFISVNDIPQVIKDYLGVIKDDEGTKEELNVRRCADRLFLIDTTGGDNYKILNSILQSEVLAKTTASLNNDKNALQSELAVKYSQLSTMRSERDRVVVSDDKSIDTFATSIEKFKGIKDRYNSISEMRSLNEKIENTIIPDEVVTVETDRISDINKMVGVLAIATKTIQPELPLIDNERISDINKMVGVLKKLDKPIQPELSLLDNERVERLHSMYSLNKLCEKPVQDELSTIDFEKLNAIERIKELYGRIDNSDLTMLETVSSNDIDLMGIIEKYLNYKNFSDNYDNINNEYVSITTTISEMAHQYDFKICKNCGTIVTD